MAEFAMRESEFIRGNMSLLCLYEEENTGRIYPTSLRSHRAALKAIVSKIRDGGELGASKTNLAEAFPDIRDLIAEMLETFREGDTRWPTGVSIPMGVGCIWNVCVFDPVFISYWGSVVFSRIRESNREFTQIGRSVISAR